MYAPGTVHVQLHTSDRHKHHPKLIFTQSLVLICLEIGVRVKGDRESTRKDALVFFLSYEYLEHYERDN